MVQPKKEEFVDVESALETSDSSGSEAEPEPKVKAPKKKMASSVTLSVLTKFIRPYNGDRETLPAFLTNCENAISLATTEQQNVLIKYIVSQLEGKAQLACCLKNFESWSDIKSFLKTTFGEKKHSTHLLVDLQNCRQKADESVTQYSLQIESCLTRLQSDIHYSCVDKSELVGRLAAMEDLALNTFMLGMNTKFAHIVRCRNPKTLSEAITHAIEEEKIFNLSRVSQRASLQCSFCHQSGHSASDCFKKRKQSNEGHRVHAINSPPSQSGPSSSKFDRNKSCAYCKKVGHLITECFRLKRKNGESSSSPQASVHTALEHSDEIEIETDLN